MRAIDLTSPGGGGSARLDLAVQTPRVEFEIWRNGLRRRALAHVADFVESRCVPQLEHTGVDVAESCRRPNADEHQRLC